jgi:membrane protein required for colicin V production
MNWFDGIIIGIFLVSCAIGLYRGFARELLSLIIWVAAILFAKFFSADLAALLLPYIKTESLATVIAFLVLFIVTLLVGAILGLMLSALVRTTGLTGSDRVLGFLFGAARAFIIVMVLVVVLPEFLVLDKYTQWKQAKLIPYFLECKDWVWIAYDYVTQWIATFFGNEKFGSKKLIEA